MGLAVKTDHDVHIWAELAKDHPEAAWGVAVLGAIAFVTVNFAWWAIELPTLVNAHDDSRLAVAVAGSVALIVFDAIAPMWAWRRTHRIIITIRNARIEHHDQD